MKLKSTQALKVLILLLIIELLALNHRLYAAEETHSAYQAPSTCFASIEESCILEPLLRLLAQNTPPTQETSKQAMTFIALALDEIQQHTNSNDPHLAAFKQSISRGIKFNKGLFDHWQRLTNQLTQSQFQQMKDLKQFNQFLVALPPELGAYHQGILLMHSQLSPKAQKEKMKTLDLSVQEKIELWLLAYKQANILLNLERLDFYTQEMIQLKPRLNREEYLQYEIQRIEIETGYGREKEALKMIQNTQFTLGDPLEQVIQAQKLFKMNQFILGLNIDEFSGLSELPELLKHQKHQSKPIQFTDEQRLLLQSLKNQSPIDQSKNHRLIANNLILNKLNSHPAFLLLIHYHFNESLNQWQRADFQKNKQQKRQEGLSLLLLELSIFSFYHNALEGLKAL